MSMEKRQPLILTDPAAAAKQPAGRCGEIVGAKTAECAAICCCCPCVVIDFVFLTVVKLPAGLFKKAMKDRRKRRQKRRAKKSLAAAETDGKNKKKEGGCGGGDGGAVAGGKGEAEETAAKSPSVEVKEKEEEMWAQFHHTGFGRSPSQRDIS